MDSVTLLLRSVDAAAHHGRSILYIAGERPSDVRDVLGTLAAHVESLPDLRASARVHRGAVAVRITFGSGGTIALVTTDSRSYRGRAVDVVLIDPDARRQPTPNAVRSITATSEHGEAWLLTEPPLDLFASKRTSGHDSTAPTPGGYPLGRGRATPGG